MHDITDVADIRILVHAFYKKVLNDDLLSPIFNQLVEESQWCGHLKIMVSFWQTNILFEQTYKGNPIQVHIKANAEVNHSITQKHFDRWLQLWRQTIEENFQGKNADVTKSRAKDMGKFILYKMGESRKP